VVPDILTPGDGQDLFARIKHAWEKRDPDAMLELFSEDAEYRVDPFTEPLRGANAIREHWNDVVSAQDHIEFDAERIWVSGRTVLGSWHVALTRRASADRVRVRGFSAIELDDAGLIVHMREWPVTRTVGIDSSYKRQNGSGSEAGE
jgi:ketosteroid isomerase-like protein